ncbi:MULTISPECIES: beta-ketoacyl synthase N-terminal-like domain-containing protein [Streptomyces]|uniref:beta-ketoacyl synthase N-terminal-like domain-containing protein n=1 Tax=Streptomyces TaxID=1883 RepID=UPI001965DEF6|nr:MULTISPECIES: beta-ketoacyl synthase N-terminal-like domain-containing protein [Streptomyces]QRX93641.1 beta-ketoacyl synthase [Streptomyces noursei]UJB43317.1 beta-ketoacyl synthase [Streptomyces sp. A1-5]
MTTHDVRLTAPGLLTAAGTDPGDLWEALVAGKDTRRPTEALAGPWPEFDTAFLVDDPDAATLGVHRRVLRTSEKQARMALHGARLALAGPAERGPVGGPGWGLYLGLPTVDEELLRFGALDRLHKAAGSPAEVAALYGREVPPFSGLSHLNSTAAAHISAVFGLTGAMAAYSPFSDAGLTALIDGALSVAEGENEVALVGAVSPKVHPLLFAQYEELGWNGAVPGEGAAFLLAERAPGGAVGSVGPVAGSGVPGARLAGYGRAFGAGPQDRAEALVEAVHAALETAGTDAGGIGWVLPDAAWTADGARSQDAALDRVFAGAADRPARFTSEPATGVLGPAHPLAHAVLALHGLAAGRRLVADGDAVREEALPAPRALVLACGARGQVCAVVLEGAEK